MGKISADNILKYFSYFFAENRLEHLKCQNLFSGKNKKNINLSSAEYAHRVVKLNVFQ